MDKNLITNVAGAVGAAAIAAGPVLNGVQGSMDGSDWGKLVVAVMFAVIGWFTGKNAKGKKEVVPNG